MDIFRDRPFAAACFAFIISSAICLAFDGAVKIIAVALFFIAGVLCAVLPRYIRFRGDKKRLYYGAVCLLFAAAACMLSYFTFDVRAAKTEGLAGSTGEITAVVEQTTYSSSYGGFYKIKVTSLNGEKRSFNARFECSDGSLTRGDIISAHVVFAALEDTAVFPERRQSFAENIFISAVAEDSVDIIGTDRPGVMSMLKSLSGRLSATFVAVLGRREGGLTAALLLGDRSYLADDIRRDFKRSGAAHLLAVSGTHLTILAGGLDELLRRLRIRKQVRCVLCIVFTIFYTCLTGFYMSVVRSAIMAVAFSLTGLFKISVDDVTALFASVAVIIASSPVAVLDIGLQLSFVAMLALYASRVTLPASRLYTRFRRRTGSRSDRGGFFSDLRKRLSRGFSRSCVSIISSAYTSALCTLFILPLSWLYFGELPLFSPISTVLLMPVVTGVLFFSPFLLILYRLLLPQRVLSAVIGFLCRIIDLFIGSVSQMRCSVLSLRYPLAWVAVLLFAAGTVFLLLCRKNYRRYCALIYAIGVTWMTASVLSYTVAVNDSAIITASVYKHNDFTAYVENERLYVTDMSDGSYTAIQHAVASVSDLPLTELEAVVYTHLHARCAGTLTRLAQNYVLRRIILPAPETDTERAVCFALEKTAALYGAAVEYYERGDAFLIGEAAVTTAPYTTIKRSAQPVLSFYIDYRGMRFSYIGSAAEESSADSFCVGCATESDILFYGAHGPIQKVPHSYPASGAVIYSTYADMDLGSYQNTAVINDGGYFRCILRP